MKVITHNATTYLFDTIETLSEMPHESWRCVYLKPVHAVDPRRESYCPTKAKAITDLLAKSEGTIYLCEDGDIIILFQRAAKMIIDRLSCHLGDMADGRPPAEHTYDLFGVFELGRHWQGFYSLCVNKYLRAIALAEAARASAAFKATQESQAKFQVYNLEAAS